MKKIYFDGSADRETITLNNVEDLKKLCNSLDVHTDVEHKVNDLYIIRSMANVGGSQFIANAGSDYNTLKDLSERIEVKGDVTLYYIRLTGQKVDV